MSSVVDNVRFNFLYIDTYSFGRNWVFPESMVPYNMLRYIESGAATFFIDGEEVIVHKDQIRWEAGCPAMRWKIIFRLPAYVLRRLYILRAEIFFLIIMGSRRLWYVRR